VAVSSSSTNNGPRKPINSFCSLVGTPANPDDAADRKARMRASFLITAGYHRDLLHALAGELSYEVGRVSSTKLVGDHDGGLTVTETMGTFDDDEAGDVEPVEEVPVERPADALAILGHNDSGMTINVPPAGLRRASKGGFGLTIFWNGLMAVITVGVIYSTFTGNNNLNGAGEWAVATGLIALFWAIGIALLIGNIHAARRHAILDVVGDTLLVTRKTIFGLKQLEWRADQLRAIRMGESGVEINDVPVMQLQIHDADGKKHGLLSQLSNDELRWIAYELRRALGVSAEAPPTRADRLKQRLVDARHK
jgi:hypothetical protein